MVLLEWQAPEYEHHHKSRAWLVIMAIIFGLLIFHGIVTQSIIEVVLWCLAGFVTFIYALREPDIITYQITSKGIKIKNHLYSYSNIDSFWLFYDPPEVKNLSIIIKHHLTTHLHMPLGDTDPLQVRTILLDLIPEHEQKESIAEVIFRALRF